MRHWSMNNLRLSRARVEIEGLENIDRERPQIFAANHSGFHDILSLAAHFPIQFRWIAKKSLFTVPFMGWHMRRSGYIPIDEENPRKAARSILAATKEISGGVNAVIFPEGARSKTGALGEFRSGAFALCLRAEVPLVPVVVEGSYRVIAPQTLRVNPGTVVRIKICRPIDTASYQKSEKKRLMEDTYTVMSENLAELQNRKQTDEELRDPVRRWIKGRASCQ
jgi:1-acyl-sn-glycerol-3-phosphate acyltransferase